MPRKNDLKKYSPETATAPATTFVRTRDLINEFLRQKRIAIVGVSRDERDFSRTVFREFKKRGYDVVPINPQQGSIDDVQFIAGIQDVSPAPDVVVIMTPPNVTAQIVRDCAEAGVNRIWLHRSIGAGSVSDEALEFCAKHDIRVVSGYCPLMFLSDPGFVHRVHGFFLKLARAYPN